MWQQYSHEADAVVFIVDAVDHERFREAALELHKLVRGPRAPRGGARSDARRHVSQLAANTLPPRAPVLVLGNKIDLPAAAREEELYYSLGLDELTRQDPTGAARPLRLFMCSVFAGTGFMEGASSPALRPATRPDAVTPCRAHLVVRPRLIRHALSHRGDERRLAAERIRRRGPRRRRRHDVPAIG